MCCKDRITGAMAIICVAVCFFEKMEGGGKTFRLFLKEGHAMLKMITLCHGRFLFENMYPVMFTKV
jgi:hypothetical protein